MIFQFLVTQISNFYNVIGILIFYGMKTEIPWLRKHKSSRNLQLWVEDFVILN